MLDDLLGRLLNVHSLKGVGTLLLGTSVWDAIAAAAGDNSLLAAAGIAFYAACQFLRKDAGVLVAAEGVDPMDDGGL
jgi:hypothetical protein